MTPVLVDVIDLKKYYARTNGIVVTGDAEMVRAVDGVSFSIRRGEVFGLVGESGSGKSTIGHMLVQLLKPTSGTILFEGSDITAMAPREARKMKKNAQIVFQDPFSSLNPRMRAGDIISEPLRIAGELLREEIATHVHALLDSVGLPRNSVSRYPHEFSGGQRQRIAIARALALKPRLLVADECVSALDVSVKLQILELLYELKSQFDVSLLFISHDLSAVRFLCDRIAVLYRGKLVEIADKADFFRQPQHTYSQTLLSAMPTVSADLERYGVREDLSSPYVTPPSERSPGA